ncbi:hypothetical protein L6164_000975 [Bauhinia variegata]|uniref:Uncharacterized protein n=1 Tax=Bauhinia variegata TaxID=167791 RepID=A0ACB9Q7L6_BAUVA|nr:hypothetical protein L6164_000975 [Bauhinia variegata]
MKDPDDVAAYRQSVERIRVHIFLAGLEKAFNPIRKEILRQDPLPSLEECYVFVRREDIRSTALTEDIERPEASALLSHRSNQTPHDRPKASNQKNPNSSEKQLYKCTHCNQNGHTKSRCFELVGYPDWWDPKKHRNSKRSNTTAIAQAQEDDSIPMSSALVTTTNGGEGNYLNVSLEVFLNPHMNLN